MGTTNAVAAADRSFDWILLRCAFSGAFEFGCSGSDLAGLVGLAVCCQGGFRPDRRLAGSMVRLHCGIADFPRHAAAFGPPVVECCSFTAGNFRAPRSAPMFTGSQRKSEIGPDASMFDLSGAGCARSGRRSAHRPAASTFARTRSFAVAAQVMAAWAAGLGCEISVPLTKFFTRAGCGRRKAGDFAGRLAMTSIAFFDWTSALPASTLGLRAVE